MNRKRDTIKIVESDSLAIAEGLGLRCVNFKCRHDFVRRAQDPSTGIFCAHCGHLTPVRQVKFDRGLMAPPTQQETVIAQNERKGRKPRRINDDGRHDNELVKYLESKSLTVIDSQVINP